jgi:hypothetical protein
VVQVEKNRRQREGVERHFNPADLRHQLKGGNAKQINLKVVREVGVGVARRRRVRRVQVVALLAGAIWRRPARRYTLVLLAAVPHGPAGNRRLCRRGGFRSCRASADGGRSRKGHRQQSWDEARGKTAQHAIILGSQPACRAADSG